MEIDMRTEREYIEKQRLTMVDEKGIKHWACEEVGELIRCKDCIHCSKYDCWTENGIVTLNSCWNDKGMFTYVLDNDYCSRGYRRDNNG